MAMTRLAGCILQVVSFGVFFLGCSVLLGRLSAENRSPHPILGIALLATGWFLWRQGRRPGQEIARMRHATARETRKKRCVHCAEEILMEATRCYRCGQKQA